MEGAREGERGMEGAREGEREERERDWRKELAGDSRGILRNHGENDPYDDLSGST